MVNFYFIYKKEILTSNYCKLSRMYHVFNKGCDSSLAFVKSVLMWCCSWLWLTWSSMNGETLFCLLRHQIVWARTVSCYKEYLKWGSCNLSWCFWVLLHTNACNMNSQKWRIFSYIKTPFCLFLSPLLSSVHIPKPFVISPLSFIWFWKIRPHIFSSKKPKAP